MLEKTLYNSDKKMSSLVNSFENHGCSVVRPLYGSEEDFTHFAFSLR